MNTNRGTVKAAAYQQAKDGKYTCGDSYFYEETPDGYICAIADGLGSGSLAKDSSQVVIDVIQKHLDAEPEEIIKEINKELVGKRGVVIGILKLNFESGHYSFLSVGNIGLMAIANNRKKYRTITNAGYLAGYQHSFKVEQRDLEPNMNFIMFSDGVTERELSEDYMKDRNVEDIVKIYSKLTESEKRKDDTTLVALRYETHVD